MYSLTEAHYIQPRNACCRLFDTVSCMPSAYQTEKASVPASFEATSLDQVSAHRSESASRQGVDYYASVLSHSNDQIHRDFMSHACQEGGVTGWPAATNILSFSLMRLGFLFKEYFQIDLSSIRI
jgi:hypothetical protein